MRIVRDDNTQEIKIFPGNQGDKDYLEVSITFSFEQAEWLSDVLPYFVDGVMSMAEMNERIEA